MTLTPEEVFQRIKQGPVKYNEDIHCQALLKCMMNKGRLSSFCTEICISDDTFYHWCSKHDLFRDVYAVSKIFARELWEQEGEIIKHETNMPGVISNKFEHWKMIGWSRFGVSKNGRIKLKLDPKGNPADHYAQLLLQASQGDFTSSEIKQLMEAVNVGLNTHQVFALQKEIDQLKSDLATMLENTNGHNSVTTKGIAQKD